MTPRFHYDFTLGGGGASSNGKRRLIRGEGFATRISSNVRPQDPGGGAPTIAAPWGVMNIEVTDAPELSVGGPPSVPSRISVVLVQEAKAWGTPRLGCPRDDQNIQLLAGVAKPASVTVWEDSLGSPCVGGTLSSSDIAGKLLPVVPAGISFPVGPVDPAGPDGPDVAGGPVGPFGTMSPSDSDPASLADPYVAGGPVGLDWTLSPFISDHAGPVCCRWPCWPVCDTVAI